MEFKTLESCTGCGACARDCAFGVLEMKDGRPRVRENGAERCMDCQHCLAACPQGAVVVNGRGAEDCAQLADMPVPPPSEVANLIKTRRTVRQYVKADIPRGEIEALLEPLKWVPTGCNVRHLKFIVVDGAAKMSVLREKMLSTLEAHVEALPEGMAKMVAGARKHPECDVFFRGAPHLLIVVSGDGAVTPQTDCDAACAYFDVLAQTAGVGTTWFGFLGQMVEAVPEVAGVFGIPAGAKFHGMLFGEPSVDYYRCPDRSAGAVLEWL